MYSASYTYSNLSRLFIRLFVGIMFIQFGIRQMLNYDAMVSYFPASLGMESETTLILMILIELVCSTMIMLGFLTRLAIVPALFSMIIAEDYLLSDVVSQYPFTLGYMQPGYLPIMFIGIFVYLLLSGPGKISLDYLISLFIINRNQEFHEDNKLSEA